jgi:PEP-CTERM motif
MDRMKKTFMCSIGALAMCLSATTSWGAIVAEFDAVTAGAGVDPTGVVPAWTKGGQAFVNDGTVLLQNTGQFFGEYDSPLVSGLMVENTTDYSVEFTVRPLTDVAGGEWFAQQKLTWRASTSRYDISLDLDADDAGAGTTGSVRYGQGQLGVQAEAITGIDWSVARTIAIAYSGGTDTFEFFLDGASQGIIASNSMTQGSNGPLDKIRFGDGTTAAVAAGNQVEWLNVRLHDVAVPEPGTIGLMAAAGLMSLVRRRRA